jgi:hypothetical protein
MLKLILLLPAAALLLFAGEGIYYAARGRKAVAVSCATLLGEPSRSPRVLVSGCEIDFAGAGYSESGGQLEELFLPARPAGAAMPAPLVVATRHPEALALAGSVYGAGRAGTPAESLEAMRKVAAVLRISPTIDGLARTGFIERLRTRRILSGLAPPIADDAFVVDLEGRPAILRPAVALVTGTVLGLIALWPSRRHRLATDSTASDDPLLVPDQPSSPDDIPLGSAETAAPEDVAPSTVLTREAGVALPQLLLLALDVSAGPEAIETAPPLGSRSDVIAMLVGVIPDLAPDAARAVLARPDGSVKVSLGPHDPIPTAVVETHGESGVVLVKEVLLMTGWRAFAPKTGLFMGADDLDAIAALAAEGPVI